jgi:membrane protease YdiL (CAAX protease family)
LEFIYSIIAVLAILGIGQLYINKLLIPTKGNVVLDAINQFIIFSPAFILILIRKQSFDTLWLPNSKIGIRLLIGFFISVAGILVYWVTKNDANDLSSILLNTYHYQNTSHLVQVFMEDVTIALVFARLSSWIGNKWSIVIVAVLFAAGHIPSLLANGATIIEMSSLLADTLLGVIVLVAVSRSRDIWWFVMVHFVMDMTQFYG